MKPKLKKIISLASVLLCSAASMMLNAESVDNGVNIGVASVQPSISANANTQQIPKRYIVKYKDDKGLSLSSQSTLSPYVVIQNKLAELNVSIKADYQSSRVLSVEGSQAAIASLINHSSVEYVEEDAPRFLMADTIPYGISQVQAGQVSDAVHSSSNMTVCIVDSGIDANHPDLAANHLSGTNDSGTGDWFTDEFSHGSHVAGTIVGLNNDTGVIGVLPNGNVNLHIIKVFGADGWAYSSSLTAAVIRCQEAGADVVNMSLGGVSPTSFESNTFKELHENNNMILVASSGNAGGTEFNYPASYASVISVGATDSVRNIASFSQHNSEVELSAPGVSVLSTVPLNSGDSVNFSEAVVDGVGYSSNGMQNLGNANAPLFNFGTGESTNNGASGQVCLIQRGNITFVEKVKNCEDSGGVGAIIYNNSAGEFKGTLGDDNTTTIPAVTVSDVSGVSMLGQIGTTASISMENLPGYAFFSGTSMSAPHVTGVAALVWGHFPECSSIEIRQALQASAQDRGAAGRDTFYGYGIVQAKAARDHISGTTCGLGELPIIEAVISAECDNQRNCNFDASASSLGVEPNSFEWDFGDGTNNNGIITSHIFDSDGSFTVTLTVTDSMGNSDEVTQEVEVLKNEGKETVRENIWVRFRYPRYYYVDVAENMSTFTVTTSEGTGDITLYVRKGRNPTATRYDCRVDNPDSVNEECVIENPGAGRWYIAIASRVNQSQGITLRTSSKP